MQDTMRIWSVSVFVLSWLCNLSLAHTASEGNTKQNLSHITSSARNTNSSAKDLRLSVSSFGNNRNEKLSSLTQDVSVPTTSGMDSETHSDMKHASSDDPPGKMASNTTRFFSSHLLRNYDTLISPKQAQAGGTTVHVRIGVKALHGIDLSRQTMTILAWFSLYWRDERLIWDAAESGFQSIHLNSGTVWIPEIVIFNTLLSLDELTNGGRNLIVKHDGNVTWWPGGVFKTFCSLDITYYPFDVHVCSLQLTTWTYNMHQINLTILPPAFENADYSESSEWTVTAAGVTTFYSSSTPYKTLKFEFRLKRKVLFYVANVLVPIFLVSSLNCVVLRVPAGSGEKMTVCLTSFLTFLTYLKVTVDTLPRNSDVFCYFGLYLSLQLVISVFTVAMAATAVWLGWREKMYCEAKEKRTFSATKEDSGRGVSGRRNVNRRFRTVTSVGENRAESANLDILRYLNRRGLSTSIKKYPSPLTSRNFLRKRSVSRYRSGFSQNGKRTRDPVETPTVPTNTGTNSNSDVAAREPNSVANSEYRDSSVWNYRERRFAIPGDDLQQADCMHSSGTVTFNAEQQHTAGKRNPMRAELTEEKDKDTKVLRFSERVEKVGICVTLTCTVVSNASFLVLLIYRQLTRDV